MDTRLAANNAHLSLFSGIGGLDLAAEWAGFRTVAFVERDKYCQRVLAKHWPGVPIFGDVVSVTNSDEDDGAACVRPRKLEREICAKGERGQAPNRFADLGIGVGFALLSGGFPCQPHSVAGKRKASLDERDLWSECARITREFKPRWAVFENVPGLLSSEGGSFFARVLGDLAALGYRVGWGVWGANDVGALHRRDRVFIVAHSNSGGRAPIVHLGGSRQADCGGEINPFKSPAGNENDVADAIGSGRPGQGEPVDAIDKAAPGEGETAKSWHGCERGIWSIEPNVGRVANGVPKRVDRLRALGNAVVPQQAYPIFKAIAEIEGISGT